MGLALTPSSDSSLEARATVLGQNGSPSGVRVTLRISGRSIGTVSCGTGCYAGVREFRGRPTSLAVRLVRPGRRPAIARFRVPDSWPAQPAGPVVRRAARTFRALQTLTVVSRLASGATGATTTIWKLEAAYRLSYRELGTGSQAVIVGHRRWDRGSADAGWTESAQSPVRQPSPPWPAAVRSAHLLGSARVGGREVWLASFVDPVTPSWFTIAVDKRTYRTVWVDMVAAAHFMHERYGDFNRPLAIVSPCATRSAPRASECP